MIQNSMIWWNIYTYIYVGKIYRNITLYIPTRYYIVDKYWKYCWLSLFWWGRINHMLNIIYIYICIISVRQVSPKLLECLMPLASEPGRQMGPTCSLVKFATRSQKRIKTPQRNTEKLYIQCRVCKYIYIHIYEHI